MKENRIIAVCGGHTGPAKLLEDAYELGGAIAKKGYFLITGGGRGVMEAASRGAADNGGTVIGILPSERQNPQEGYPNPYVTIHIFTGMSDARNSIIAKSADVLVALGGGPGTISEIALAVKSGVPVIILKSPGFDIPENWGCAFALSIGEVLKGIEDILDKNSREL